MARLRPQRAPLSAEDEARPDLALRVLLHALIMEPDNPWRAVAKVTLRPPTLHVACFSIEAAPARADLEARSAAALDAARVPEGERLWQWLLRLDTAAALDLLAVLVGHPSTPGRRTGLLWVGYPRGPSRWRYPQASICGTGGSRPPRALSAG